MAIKPLKLKRYISEAEAAKLLSLLIGEEVSADEMAEYARLGIVPAYMQFAPKDSSTYPNCTFLIFDRDTWEEYKDHDRLRLVGADWLAVIPYPLNGSWIEDSEGGQWRVMVDRADGSVEDVAEDHFRRIYAPPEVCQAAQLMNDPNACPEWPAILHSHGQTWSYDDDGPSEPAYILSPFIEHREYIPIAKGEPRASGNEAPVNWQLSDRPTPKSYRLIISGMIELLTEARGCTQDEIAETLKERHPRWRISPSRVTKVFAEANKLAKEANNPAEA
ncbi:hypothetical protein ACIPK7_27165 [Pseudomonas sp. NPDC086581]|uniref:hypothetical protein n=1 Tax=Pseudomonas sp. NPDC086581 TaxID=3364432 RepID=UPI0037FE3E45